MIISTLARTDLPKLEAIFSRQGIPDSIKTDNRHSFNGEEFSSSKREFGINTKNNTPLARNASWPPSTKTSNRAWLRTHTHRSLNIHLRMYRGTHKTCKKLATVVEGDSKDPFLIATTPTGKRWCYSIPWIAPLYP